MLLDPVGADYLEDSLRALGTRGRWVVIGLLSGRFGRLDLGRLLVKQIRLTGSVLRPRSAKEKSRSVQAMWARPRPRLGGGEIRPVVQEVLPIQEAERAHRWMAEDRCQGKIVLQVREE